jgi:KaiC/GvpD/RAD55 family RecA-like ATPase
MTPEERARWAKMLGKVGTPEDEIAGFLDAQAEPASTSSDETPGNNGYREPEASIEAPPATSKPSAGGQGSMPVLRASAPADLIADFEAEKSLLSACLQMPNALAAIAAKVGSGELAVSDLYQRHLGKLLGVMLRLQAEGVDEFDAVTLAHVLEGEGELLKDIGGLEGIRTLRQMPDVKAVLVGRYAQIVREKSAGRQAQAALEAALATIGDGHLVADALAEVEGKIADARAMVEATEGTSIAEPIDWAGFWQDDDEDAEWVFDEVLAKGRGHAIFAKHKTGKSIFTLWLAAQIAIGDEPVVVAYFDMEMTRADVRDRLRDMGFGPDTDVSRLRRLNYYLLPNLPDLDTAQGGLALMAILDRIERAYPDHHIVVIIDTIGRVVEGEEDKSDTWRHFYRHTGIRLKRRGTTWLRLDHAGKKRTQGQRGSSAKGDDVDVVWELQKSNAGIVLKRDAARMPWVPEKVTFTIPDDPPMRYVRRTDDWPDHTGEVANILDRLEVPLDASANVAMKRLHDIDEGRHKSLVLAALKYRRKLSEAERS